MTADSPQPSNSSAAGAWLRRAIAIEPGEGRAFLASTALFFVILCSMKLVRGVREVISTVAGVGRLTELWSLTLVVTVVANLLYWWLVNRMPRRQFVTWSLHVCAACLIAFWLLLQSLSGKPAEYAGYAFYAWYSAFNLCIISLFWVCMVDHFSVAQARRLFGPIGIGGTLGGILGATLAEQLVATVTPAGLFLIAAGALEVAVVVNLWREREAARSAHAPRGQFVASAGLWNGLVLVVRHPTLRWFALLAILMATVQTGLYAMQIEAVPQLVPDKIERAAYYSQKDRLTDTFVLVFELFVTGRLLQHVGVAFVLALMPLVTLGAMAAFTTWPVLGVLLVVHALADATRHGLSRPAREVLFTPLGREAKYKSKAFLDSFVVRGADAASAQLFESSRKLVGVTLPLFTAPLFTWVTAPFAIACGACAWAIGRRHERDVVTSTAARSPAPDTPAAASSSTAGSTAPRSSP